MVAQAFQKGLQLCNDWKAPSSPVATAGFGELIPQTNFQAPQIEI